MPDAGCRLLAADCCKQLYCGGIGGFVCVPVIGAFVSVDVAEDGITADEPLPNVIVVSFEVAADELDAVEAAEDPEPTLKSVYEPLVICSTARNINEPSDSIEPTCDQISSKFGYALASLERITVGTLVILYFDTSAFPFSEEMSNVDTPPRRIANLVLRRS